MRPSSQKLLRIERPATLVGVAISVVGVLALVFSGGNHGVFLAFFGTSVFASIGSLDKWPRERGVWMLGGFLALIWGAMVAAIALGTAHDFLKGSIQLHPSWLGLEATVAFGCLAFVVWHAVWASIWNWRLTYPPEEQLLRVPPWRPPEPPPESLGVPARPRRPSPSLVAAARPPRSA